MHRLHIGACNLRLSQHRSQTFAHVRVFVRVEVFLQNIQGNVKALSLLFGSNMTINQVECNLLRYTDKSKIYLFCLWLIFCDLL